jgi:hypothetical protein
MELYRIVLGVTPGKRSVGILGVRRSAARIRMLFQHEGRAFQPGLAGTLPHGIAQCVKEGSARML